MSAEIICQDGFCLEISVTSRVNPYNALLHSPYIISNSKTYVKRLNKLFLTFLKKIFHVLFLLAFLIISIISLFIPVFTSLFIYIRARIEETLLKACLRSVFRKVYRLVILPNAFRVLDEDIRAPAFPRWRLPVPSPLFRRRIPL